MYWELKSTDFHAFQKSAGVKINTSNVKTTISSKPPLLTSHLTSLNWARCVLVRRESVIRARAILAEAPSASSSTSWRWCSRQRRSSCLWQPSASFRPPLWSKIEFFCFILVFWKLQYSWYWKCVWSELIVYYLQTHLFAVPTIAIKFCSEAIFLV